LAGAARQATWERLLRLRRCAGSRTRRRWGWSSSGRSWHSRPSSSSARSTSGASALSLRLVLLADLVYVLVVATLVLGTIARMVAARRAKSAGSQLHLRLTGVFALIALIPTVTVAVFAGLTVNVGLEGWFSERVRQVVGASLAAAEAYREDSGSRSSRTPRRSPLSRGRAPGRRVPRRRGAAAAAQPDQGVVQRGLPRPSSSTARARSAPAARAPTSSTTIAPRPPISRPRAAARRS
jgi:hypothetical protein